MSASRKGPWPLLAIDLDGSWRETEALDGAEWERAPPGYNQGSSVADVMKLRIKGQLDELPRELKTLYPPLTRLWTDLEVAERRTRVIAQALQTEGAAAARKLRRFGAAVYDRAEFPAVVPLSARAYRRRYVVFSRALRPLPPKLEEPLPVAWLPERLTVLDYGAGLDSSSGDGGSGSDGGSGGGTPGRPATTALVVHHYCRVLPAGPPPAPAPASAPNGIADHASPTLASAPNRVANHAAPAPVPAPTPAPPCRRLHGATLYLHGDRQFARGSHARVFRAPLELPYPLSTTSGTARGDHRVTVVAKVASSAWERHHMDHEAANLAAMAADARYADLRCGTAAAAAPNGAAATAEENEDEDEEYCPVVPHFYGYYAPADDFPDERWRPPLLLTEDCGEPIDAVETGLSAKNVVRPLLERLHAAGAAHLSVHARNVLVQPGPLAAAPAARSLNRASVRLIDLGRCVRREALVGRGMTEAQAAAELVQYQGEDWQQLLGWAW